MALSFVYLAFVSLLRLLMRCGPTVDVKDIELLVLPSARGPASSGQAPQAARE